MKHFKKISIFVLTAIFLPLFVFAKSDIQDKRPNVLFIIVDTLRADHLGCYGYSQIKTPNIDSLAKGGTLFKNVIAQAPLTFPSHCSLFTSTYPQFNNMRDNGNQRLGKANITLAEKLQDNGYTTAAFIGTFVLDSKFGLDQGFQIYDDQMQKVTAKRVIKMMDEEERKADKVTEAAINWLKANKDKKFFLWVHYYDPHTIYNPPSPYKELYKNNLYDGEVAFCDEYIGVLLASLKELNLDSNTLIIFASDHGESLGEHDENGHAIFVYDTTTRVPLIFSYPGVIPEGKVIENQVSLIDIMPTILDLLGIKKNKEIQGRELARLIKGNQKSWDLPAYSESFYAKLHFNWSQLQAYYVGDWKYIKSSEPELYNVKDDPTELINLAKAKTDIVNQLNKQLQGFLKKTGAPEKKETKAEIDKETKEKLMSLGYIGGSVSSGSEPVPREMIQVMEKMNLYTRMANEGMIDRAIAGFIEVSNIDPTNMEANLRLAQCYKEQGKYDEAIKYFRKAASSKANLPEVHNGLGTIYKDMGRAEEALKEFKLALELDPEDAAAINNIGWYYQQKLQVDKAMEYYQAALKLDNNMATTHSNIAILYRIKGNLDKAIEELNIAMKLEPELSYAYAEMCACIATKGDIDKAIPYCQKAIELNPRGLDGYNNLGVCYERKGEYDQALENYLKAQEIAPWNSLIYCNIGKVYMQRKDFEQAKEYLNKALQVDPNCQRAMQMLKAISQDKGS
jgi:arylsulfatase A-like enzyme/Flp pilus assembly protein TadD